MTVTSETEVFVGVPDTSEGWIDRAREVSNILAAAALARDRAGEPPFREVQLLKDSGLVTLLGPVEFGGGGQRWESAYKVVREIARADGSIGTTARIPLPVGMGSQIGRNRSADLRCRGAVHEQPILLRRRGEPSRHRPHRRGSRRHPGIQRCEVVFHRRTSHRPHGARKESSTELRRMCSLSCRLLRTA